MVPQSLWTVAYSVHWTASRDFVRQSQSSILLPQHTGIGYVFLFHFLRYMIVLYFHFPRFEFQFSALSISPSLLFGWRKLSRDLVSRHTCIHYMKLPTADVCLCWESRDSKSSFSVCVVCCCFTVLLRLGSPIVSPSGTLAFPPPCTVTTENPRLSTTCRSGIYNFFVTANQPTVSSTPVIPTTSEPERKSPEPAMVILDLVPGSPPKEIPVSEPVAKTPSRETPKPEEPIPKKRPKDLLRHVIGGETIFESLSGPFSVKRKSDYHRRYYK